MNKHRKSNIVQKREKKPQGKDFACFFALVKESAKLGPISFVIVDDYDHRMQIRIEHGQPVTINGKNKDDGQVMDFIAKVPSEFEGLFIETMKKKYDPDLHIMPKLHVAKLTDLSGFYGRPAVVEIHDGASVKKFRIERSGADGCYYIDTKMVSKSEAIAFVEANYGNFLVGMRKAVKDMKGHKHIQNKYPATSKEKKKEVKHSEFVDGKLQVDIDSFLPKKNVAGSGDKIMTKGDKIMTTAKRGYIEE